MISRTDEGSHQVGVTEGGTDRITRVSMWAVVCGPHLGGGELVSSLDRCAKNLFSYTSTHLYIKTTQTNNGLLLTPNPFPL